MTDNVQKAVMLEDLDSIIDKKELDIHSYNTEYQEIVKRLNQFVNDYKAKTSSFVDSVNKEIDSFYSAFDVLDAAYTESLKKLEAFEAEFKLDLNSYDEGAREIVLELNNKILSLAGSIRKEIEASLDAIIKAYEHEAQKLLKASQRLSKLKDRKLINK